MLSGLAHWPVFFGSILHTGAMFWLIRLGFLWQLGDFCQMSVTPRLRRLDGRVHSAIQMEKWGSHLWSPEQSYSIATPKNDRIWQNATKLVITYNIYIYICIYGWIIYVYIYIYIFMYLWNIYIYIYLWIIYIYIHMMLLFLRGCYTWKLVGMKARWHLVVRSFHLPGGNGKLEKPRKTGKPVMDNNIDSNGSCNGW